MKKCHSIFSTYFFTNSIVPNSTTISHSPCIIYSVFHFFLKLISSANDSFHSAKDWSLDSRWTWLVTESVSTNWSIAFQETDWWGSRLAAIFEGPTAVLHLKRAGERPWERTTHHVLCFLERLSTKTEGSARSVSKLIYLPNLVRTSSFFFLWRVTRMTLSLIALLQVSSLKNFPRYNEERKRI